MEFRLTEEQRILKQTLREFTASEMDPLVGELEKRDEFPAAIIRKLN